MRNGFRIAGAAVFALALLAGQADAQAKKTKKKVKARPPAAAMDKDIAAIGGTGVPAGYKGRTDDSTAMLRSAKYAVSGRAWEVTTGPAHILYNPANVATGSYTVSATFEQLGKPAHPEAYGLFIGGQNLDQPSQNYLYFLVRGNGQMLAKTREGKQTVGKIAWQVSPAIAAEDAAGKATYKIRIQVTPDSVRFWVNGHQAAALSKQPGLPTEGIYGIRINHNLHVRVSPVTITRP